MIIFKKTYDAKGGRPVLSPKGARPVRGPKGGRPMRATSGQGEDHTGGTLCRVADAHDRRPYKILIDSHNIYCVPLYGRPSRFFRAPARAGALGIPNPLFKTEIKRRMENNKETRLKTGAFEVGK